MAAGEHTVVSNRRARHEFEILERIEAGLVLMGTEVKSLRDGKVVLRDAYATRARRRALARQRDDRALRPGEPREPRADARAQAARATGSEFERLASRVAEKGLTLVPLRIYFKDGRAKIEIALARGKEGRDKRDSARRARHRAARSSAR